MKKSLVKELVSLTLVCGATALVINLIDPNTVLAATQGSSASDLSFASAIRKLQKPARLVSGFFAAWGFIIIAKGDSSKGLKRIYLALGGYAGIMGLNWIFDFIDGFFGW